MSIRALTFASLIALTACSSQADPTYPGQPLATLQGNAIAVDDGALPPLDVALQWNVVLVGGDLSTEAGVTMRLNTDHPVPTKAAVAGQFPSAFTLQILAPPPDDVMAACRGGNNQAAPGHYALAEISAVRRGAETAGFVHADVFGTATEFVLAYADSNLSVCNGVLVDLADPSTITKGYHLYRRVVGPCVPANNVELFPCRSYVEVPLNTVINLPIVSSPGSHGTERIYGAGTTTPPLFCSDGPFPADADGNVKCRMVIDRYTPDGKPYWGPCDGPGESAADDQTIADNLGEGEGQHTTECLLSEVPSAAWVNGSCAASPVAGWCAPSGSATCTSPIQLSALAPALPANLENSVLSLVCP